MKLMIADDDARMCLLLRQVLRFVEAEVLVAQDGKEAMALWQAERPQFVIADRVMPGARGTDLCRLIRETPSEGYTYVIMLTACETPEEVVEGLESGADDYVVKPFRPGELTMRVKAGLRVLALEAALGRRITELREALDRVHVLEGLLPICSYCKRIRDDNNQWHSVESYLRSRADVDFTHGICPNCLARVSEGRLGA
jgi:sigma-B regulation protein RsbU (phosphoserine phosphatase)